MLVEVLRGKIQLINTVLVLFDYFPCYPHHKKIVFIRDAQLNFKLDFYLFSFTVRGHVFKYIVTLYT